MKILTTAVLLMTLLIAACNKKDKTQSRADILTSGSWKLTAAEEDADGDGTYETDNYAFFLDWFKDNYVIFRPGGQMEANEGPAKCDAADPQIEMFSWQLTNNDNSLVVDGDTYEILELTPSSLKLKEVFGGGRSAKSTFSKR